jgi:hypothetical protein
VLASSTVMTPSLSTFERFGDERQPTHDAQLRRLEYVVDRAHRPPRMGVVGV